MPSPVHGIGLSGNELEGLVGNGNLENSSLQFSQLVEIIRSGICQFLDHLHCCYETAGCTVLSFIPLLLAAKVSMSVS